MIVKVWKNSDGLHVARPAKPSTLVDLDFDPDQPCRVCGEHVVTLLARDADVCRWCDSGVNRPKMLRYQEIEMIRQLERHSAENEEQHIPQSRIRNRSTEKDLRDHLTNIGFHGRSANFLKLDLAAIERPGWVQVFEFHVQAKRQDGDWEELFGLCRTDERNDTFEVQLFDQAEPQQQVLSVDAANMITRERGPRHWSWLPLMLIFGAAVILALIGAAMSPQ